jgi:hypothetical protein
MSLVWETVYAIVDSYGEGLPTGCGFPFRVIRVISTERKRLPLFTQVRTCLCVAPNDATGQTRTSEGRLTLPITKVRQGGGKQGRFTVVFTEIPA